MRPLGWYPDEVGGTRFWDGHRWTGDIRPPRNSFSAASSSRGWGTGLLILGALLVLTSPAQFSQLDPPVSPRSAFAFALVMGAGCIGWGIYLLRGRGPSTKAILKRIHSEQISEASIYQSAPPGANATVQININNGTTEDSVTAAQVRAIANPETAKAIQELQKLLYTRAISDSEFQAAKDKLLGDSPH